MTKLSVIDWIALILTIIGGLNWGLVAMSMDWNVVAMLPSWLATTVYALVGLSAIWMIVLATRLSKKSDGMPQM